MFFGKKDAPAAKTETRNVQVLKFGPDGRGDNLLPDGAVVPNETRVYDGDRVVGRAVLNVREDGIYADIMLERGTLTDVVPKAIATTLSFDSTPEGRNITRFEVLGVGLHRVVETKPVNVQPDETQSNEKTTQSSEAVESKEETQTPAAGETNRIITRNDNESNTPDV